MPLRRSTFAELAAGSVLALAALVASERLAHAQACCVAPGAAGVSRLAMYETILAGVDARAQTAMGSFDATGRFRPAPANTRDVALEQSLFVTARAFSRGQLTLAVPFVETLRTSGPLSSAGGGLGDIRVSGRWDIVTPDEARPAPGVALIGGAVAPTGRPPERATDALGAGATGTGAAQGWAGLNLERTWGPWLALATTSVTLRTEREVGTTRLSLPPRLSAGLVGAYAWTSGVALSLGVAYGLEGRASVDGRTVSGSARRALTTTLALQVPIGDFGRIVGTVFATPPLPAVTAGEPAPLGVSLAIVKPWS